MLDAFIELLNTGIFWGLLALGGYLVLMNIRTLLFPQKIGTLASFGEGSHTAMEAMTKKALGGCSGCSLAASVDGKMSFPVQIKLKDDTLEKAEVSPCVLCMDRLKIGDKVGVTKVGSRTIVQKAGLLAGLRG